MGISIWQLLIILAIVLLLFGAKRLRTLGGDIGTSVKGFRDAMKEGEKEQAEKSAEDAQSRIADGKDGTETLDGEVIKERDKA